MDSEKENYSYKGWLNSDSFFKRVFSITAYSALGTLLVWGGLLIILSLVGLSEDDNLDEELQELKEFKDLDICLGFCVDLDSYDYDYSVETKLCSCFDINDNLIEQLIID